MHATPGRGGIFERYISALHYRDFRYMWGAGLAAQAAAWALIVARGWLVFDQTGSSTWVGITTFAAMGPMFIVPPFIGVLADRIDRRTILAWTYAINLVHNLVFAVLVIAGTITLWQIVLLSLVNGVVRAAQLPTSQALAANLVPRSALLNALSLTAATQHASRLIGPGIVTPMLVQLGAPSAFLMCTLFYAIGLVLIRRIETRSVGGLRPGESFIKNFTDGLKYAAANPLIKMVLILVFFHCGLTMAFESLMPGFVHEHLTGFHDGGFGLLMIAVGCGGLVGSIYIGGVQSSLVRGRLFLVMGIISGVGQMLLSFAPGMAVAFAAAALMGGAQAGFMTMSQAITQSLASDEYRGRLASINTFSLGGVMSLMNLVNGYFSSQVGSAAVLLVSGGLFALIMLLSPLAITPRQIYRTGIPAEAHAT